MKLLPFKTLETASQLRRQNHGESGVFFRCHQCGISKPVGGSGCGTGYGYKSHNARFPICYSCCGENERRDMMKRGKACLYLANGFVTNWPGSLKLRVRYQKSSWHNMAGKDGRTDCWFTGPDGKEWHGTSIGKDNQVLRCKRLKS